MRFHSKKVLRYLKNSKNKLLATMRTWNYKMGQRVYFKNIHGRVLGYGTIINILSIDRAGEVVEYSGFNDVEEWLEEARRLHGRVPKSIYVIRIEKVRSNDIQNEVH